MPSSPRSESVLSGLSEQNQSTTAEIRSSSQTSGYAGLAGGSTLHADVPYDDERTLASAHPSQEVSTLTYHLHTVIIYLEDDGGNMFLNHLHHGKNTMKYGSGIRPMGLFAAVYFAATIAIGSPAEGVEPDDVRNSLRKAARYLQEISINGGFPASYALDRAKRLRRGEESESSARIRIHPPGTPSAGDAFLRAWRVTGEEVYRKGAVRTAYALAWGQRSSGGWGYHADVSGLEPGKTGAISRRDGRSNFDDAMTQGPLLFLMKLDRDVDKEWLTGAIDRGLSLLVEAQFENGAWPQGYPLDGGYSDYYTFNDAAINDCIDVLLQAHRQYGDRTYLKAVRKAGDFLISSQGEAPQAGWAQQYSHDMTPAWARGFEPPGFCSAVTGRNIRTLVELYLYTEDERYLSPVPDAIGWLQRSKIGDNRWARLYDVETNRPVYGDRNDPNKKHFDYEDISEEERNNYAWQGSYGIPDAVEYYRQVKETGVTRYKQRHPGAPAVSLTIGGLSADGPEGSSPGADAIQEILRTQDEQGRWVQGNRIRIATFVDHMNTLCDYLDANGTSPR